MCTAPTIVQGTEKESFVRPDSIRRAILGALAKAPTRPTDLLTHLQQEFNDFEIKEVLLRLLQEGELELTSERRLRLTSAA